MPCREAIVEFAALGSQSIGVRLLESGVNYDNMLQYEILAINPGGLPPLRSETNVIGYGTTLRQALSVHTAVDAELVQLFGTGAPNQGKLHFAFSTPGAEMYRWEAICNAMNRFLALNGSCSVNRIPISGATQSLPLRTFSGPIHLVAFLSPAGVQSEGEFDVITAAVAGARKRGLEIKTTIYLGEQGLLTRAQADVAAGRLTDVIVRPIPATAPGIEAALRGDSPQILHFFCHGSAQAGEQLLEFASINDNDTDEPSGSILLSVERLWEVLVAIGTVWATVLNSCCGAKAVPRLYSMAATLVSRGGSPITVGMAEEISDDDATLFARFFYEDALELLRQAITPLQPGAGTVIDLAPAVARARKELHAKYEHDEADAFGRWCLPVLYQRKEPLRVTRLTDPEMRSRIEAVAQALRILPSSTPIEIRAELLQVLDKDPPVPLDIRPDRFGNLP